MLQQGTDKIIKERIDKGNCPLCDKILPKNVVLVEHSKYGVISVCDSHIVQDTNKLQS